MKEDARSSELDRWLADEKAAPEADWALRLVRLGARGGLGRAGSRVLLDLPALAQPYGCDSAGCAPGLRPEDTRSCCADLEVAPTREERERIQAALPEIHAWMAPRDGRWAGGAPEVFADGALRRPGRRCVFAAAGSAGLTCALHAVEDETGRARGALKPLPCRLFPLAVIDLGGGQRLLTAVHRDTARNLGSHPARRFPCLRRGGLPPLIEAEAETVRALLGPRVAALAARAVAAWRARISV